MQKYISIILAFSLVTLSCQPNTKDKSKDSTQEINAFFDKVFEGEVSRKPQFQTRLGRKTHYGEWNDYSRIHHEMEVVFAKNILQTLNDSFDIERLDKAHKLSYRLLKYRYENVIKSNSFFDFKFWVNQMHGIQSEIPSFLINKHKITTKEEANYYTERIKKIPTVLNQITQNLQTSALKNIIVPKFVLEHVINDSKNIIEGYPLTDKGQNTLYLDFNKKIKKLTLPKEEEQLLIEDLTVGLKLMRESYAHFIDFLEELKTTAPLDGGLWQYENGDKYYQYTLEKHTTSNYTAEEIHQIGLSEVDRIHNEMKKIMATLKFDGDLNSFFKYMKNENKFYYPATDEGRSEYIDEAKGIISGLKAKLPEMFTIFPKAKLIVKQVESFREKSAGKAFYEDPAPDGSRPGTFYVNTYNMKSIPIYQLEALAYHEGIPGHHMQIAIAQENQSLPKFRKFDTFYNAYVEGWALYSEALPKEFGLYEDPYSDFGRLAMELWRACRLVVDTGIHYKKWTRQESIDYYQKNTPNDIGDCVKMVERHFVMPGQATSYKMGMLKIMSLRKKAKNTLKDRFDIKAFHDLILTSGPIPLDILEENVNDWIEEITSK